MIKYSLVIPFYNEEKNIRKVVNLLKEVSKRNKFIEFILVNNGSTDDSDIIFKKILLDKNKKIFKLFNVKKNIGYGYGIKYGLARSKGDYLAWTHSDLQTDPRDVLKAINLLNHLKEKNNYLIKGLRIKRGDKETFQTKAMEIISSIFLGIKIKDINAQPKLITRNYFLKFIKHSAPNDLSFDLYCYALAVFKKFKIYEVKVIFKKRKFGEVKGGGEGGSFLSKIKLILVTLRCLINLRFNHNL